MIKKQILILFAFLFIVNYVFSQNIVSQDIEITASEFDTYKIKESLKIVDLNNTTIELLIVPSYDLIVRVNGQRHNSIFYNTEMLTINLEKDLKEINVEIIYLTDYYTSKNNSIWKIYYNSRNLQNINTLKITLPKESKIKEIPALSSAQVVNGQMVLSFKDIKEINIDYELNTKKAKNNYYLLIASLFIFVVGYLIVRKPKLKKETKKIKARDLLLGLNENEQKIIRIIMENEGQSQKIITAKSFLPKGTVSRNIKKLIDKGYIEIKKYGVSNKLFLGEVFKKGEKNE